MIHFLLAQNKVGRTRIAKYYVKYTPEERSVLEREVHRIITTRGNKQTNFIDYRNQKIVYRRYAGLYFTIACDNTDNELGMIEAIHLFVETMNRHFGVVSELNLVFDFAVVHLIMDEIFLAGHIQETSIPSILNNVKQLNLFEE
ncbi:Sigma adaptin [Spironucleus salmonicida]|uniref:AP complex subunit sigma n=1 Tax=Spironucleus salmonicida TaxID=348837 RepID=V6LXZ6_9EUKA|nr:Sigma adaptin [Spironucleus salmonicida]|eukprot:EST48591.1 Sigma adaptin [Spironucleus salmonicida]